MFKLICESAYSKTAYIIFQHVDTILQCYDRMSYCKPLYMGSYQFIFYFCIHLPEHYLFYFIYSVKIPHIKL